MRMMVSVVMSSATRVPCFILALSTFDRHPTTYRGPDDALTMTRMREQGQHLRRCLLLTAEGNAHLSSSNCFSTSPMIWPTLCSALMLSSVWSYSFCRPLISNRRFLSFVSHSRDSISFCLKEARACSRSWSDA